MWVRRIVPSAAGLRLPRLDAPGLGNEQRVPQVARRVIRRDVQQLEVVLLGLDLGALEDLEAVGVEDLAQVAHQGLHRMQVADRHRPARRAHVDRLGGQSRLEAAGLELAEPSLDRRFELLAELVRTLADRRAFRRRHRSELAQEPGQASRSSEQVVPQPIHRIGVCSGCQRVPGVDADAFQVVGDRHWLIGPSSMMGENERPRPGFRDRVGEDRRRCRRSGGKGGLGGRDDRRERGRLANGHVGQDLPVHLDARGLQARR